MKKQIENAHEWHFVQNGGLVQVCISSIDDVLNLDKLDPKFWTALTCPVSGLEFSEETLNLLDSDKNGRVRVPEILGVVSYIKKYFKKPEIIMADEPSGALDSETGIQIFEILKQMSKDKLVIVVSHDRDFAEQYGDRIIELKDGKVISDVSKVTENQVSVTENIEYVGNLLHIRNGALLDQKDFEKLEYPENIINMLGRVVTKDKTNTKLIVESVKNIIQDSN